jgi:ABC-type multidrug transport system ATPase subunit
VSTAAATTPSQPSGSGRALPPVPPPPAFTPTGFLVTDPAPRPGGIEVRDLRRSFGTVRALDGVDLTALPGRVTALVGPNGSGKTTLLLVLAGLLVPDGGHVRVAGSDPVTDGLRARARTGWMPDAFGTWDSLTAREVLLTFAAAYRMPRDAAADRVRTLLDTVHLAEYADRPASVLSRGQKQRLGLARALVHSPDVLLLDEPASGLDPRSRVDLRVLLRELAAAGATVLVSSHVLSELDEMADDAVFLSRGRTAATSSMAGGGAGPGGGAAIGRRTWRVSALSRTALTDWLTSVGAQWRADDPERGFAPPPPDGAGAVLIEVDGDQGAAQLVRDAVEAGVPLTSIAPAGGLLEQAYLALDEERR